MDLAVGSCTTIDGTATASVITAAAETAKATAGDRKRAAVTT
jgi:hypothetical protein